MHSTTVLSSRLADSLKWRTDMAHVGVSTLGKMFSTLRLPENFDSPASDRSPPTSWNAGAVDPTAGNLPLTLIG